MIFIRKLVFGFSTPFLGYSVAGVTLRDFGIKIYHCVYYIWYDFPATPVIFFLKDNDVP